MMNEPQRAPRRPGMDDMFAMFAAALGNSAARRNPTDAIPEAEKGAQSSFTHSDTLPTRFNGGNRSDLEGAGVVFGEPVTDDPLFTYVTLPAGWSKQPTDHYLWTNLVDDKGRTRATIFYKGVFYDRDAFINVVRRFSAQRDYNRDDVIVFQVKDGDTSVFTSKEYTFDTTYSPQYFDREKEASAEARAWLDAHYPGWEDASKHWD